MAVNTKAKSGGLRRSSFWDGVFAVFTLGFGGIGHVEFPRVLTDAEARAADLANMRHDWTIVGEGIMSAMAREGAAHVQ